VPIPDQDYFVLRQVDQARTDFAIIEDQLEAIHARLQRTPTRMDVARLAFGTIVGSAGLVVLFKLWWRCS
jgi:hypothetical protein